MASDVTAIRVHAPAAVALFMATLVPLGAFGWPFLLEPGGHLRASSPGTDAPWIFAMVLPLLAPLVLAAPHAGNTDATATAPLGLPASVTAATRSVGKDGVTKGG